MSFPGFYRPVTRPAICCNWWFEVREPISMIHVWFPHGWLYCKGLFEAVVDWGWAPTPSVHTPSRRTSQSLELHRIIRPDFIHFFLLTHFKSIYLLLTNYVINYVIIRYFWISLLKYNFLNFKYTNFYIF